ncbi:alpha/beta hydrolase [Streptomyces sp. NPDC044571]|uniref:alpha/beta fold hydrolase n=1 Tax=Streptomyces sp. NPDC044571 TaxID=3155371 RepID=UPI0033C0C6E2
MMTPTAWAVDLASTPGQKPAAARLRAGREPYDTAIAAYERIVAGGDADTDWDRAAPVFYGRWDERARVNHAAGGQQQNEKAALAFAGPGAFDPPATRQALRRLTAEVLVLAGELDGNPPPALAAQLAELFPRGAVDVQPGAAHFPFLDDPEWFAARIERFLSEGAWAPGRRADPAGRPRPGQGRRTPTGARPPVRRRTVEADAPREGRRRRCPSSTPRCRYA